MLALLVVATPSRDARPPAAPDALRPDLAALGTLEECSVPPRGLALPCVANTEAARRAMPLARAPWVYRTAGRTLARAPRLPSLVFPPGTTYAEAVDALVVNATLTGSLPPGTRLAAPLPDGVVLLRPRDPSRGIAVDLRAPLAYGPGGFIFGATYLTDGDTTPAGARAVWPRNVRLAVPTLPACMVAADRRTGPARCGRDDVPKLGARSPRAPELPEVPLLAPRVTGALLVLRWPSGGPTKGAHLSLESFRGRVLVAAPFASWCRPCRDVAPAVRAVTARYAGSNDVQVVGLDVNDLTSDGLQFVRRESYEMIVLRDPAGEGRASMRIAGLPDLVVIGRDGRARNRFSGAGVREEAVARAVERALAAP